MLTDSALEALQRACWHCHHYRGLTPSGNSARCMFRGRLHIHAPLGSCCYFEREPGSDDCLTPPAGFDMGGLSDAWREMVREVLTSNQAA
ncbi:hypothetical protein [Pseudaquabacterium pictum]|nr:hypothetical protein [Rubrivivax pictus]